MPICDLPGNRFEESPAALKRWGFLFLFIPLACLQLSGCASSGRTQCLTPEAAQYTASEDSLGLDEFLALPESKQSDRHRLAREWLDEAKSTGRSDAKVGALSNAAGLAPDNPYTWLRLAHIWRWIGDYVRTSTSLENAAAAVRKLDSSYTNEEKREAQRRTALARAWLHYDRGEYREALRWAKAGEQISPGDKWIRQVMGLIEGSLNHRSQAHEIAGDMTRAEAGDTDPRWVMAVLDRSQGRFREAFNYIADLRPDHEHSAECYRDKGEIAEHLREWSYARRWYAESASALPFDDTSCLTEVSHPRLEPGPLNSKQPLWLAFDRYYVTGSLSSYTALALKRFDSETDPVEKEFWAGQVVNAAGILLRKEMHRAWSLRARGLVFAEKGMSERGLKDLQLAARLLAAEGEGDSRLAASIGRLLLLEEDHEQALTPLREAVELDPKNARAWSDLGLCLIMSGNRTEADQALSQAIELKSDLAAAWYNRGLMNLHEGKLDQAEADLNQAARLAPGNAEITKLLQQVNIRRKQK